MDWISGACMFSSAVFLCPLRARVQLPKHFSLISSSPLLIPVYRRVSERPKRAPRARVRVLKGDVQLSTSAGSCGGPSASHRSTRLL